MYAFLYLPILKIDWLVEDQKCKNNKLRCIFPEIMTLDVLKQFFSIAKNEAWDGLLPPLCIFDNQI